MTKTLKRLLNEIENLDIDYVCTDIERGKYISFTSLNLQTQFTIVPLNDGYYCRIYSEGIREEIILNKENFHMILSKIVDKYFE